MLFLEDYCKSNFMTVNTGKTKVMKFRKGGKLADSDILSYRNADIEFVSSFEYLGIILTPKLVPAAHIKHLIKKARMSTGSLQCKTPFLKLSFYAAYRLYESVILPAGNYGLQVYDDIISDAEVEDLYTKIAGFFFKKWLGISTFSSSRKILDGIFTNDFLKVQTCSAGKRRAFGLFYNNGLHNLLCEKIECYRIEIHDLNFVTGFSLCESCKCRFCGLELLSDYHLALCEHFDLSIPLDCRILHIVLG